MVSTAASSGCVANMDEFKQAIGAVEAPHYEAPLARAVANATTLLVGEMVRLSGEASRDPQDLALEFEWVLPDSALSGQVVEHAFAAPGEQTIRLRVTNTAGLVDEDVLTLRVAPADARPVAAFLVHDAAGSAAARGVAGAPLTFDATMSRDAEGAVTLAWDFGDGASSREAVTQHVYATPGHYAVALVATDAIGQQATASTRLAIDGAWTFGGSFGPDAASRTFEVPVVPAAQSLALTLAWTAAAGVEHARVVVYDADGVEVAATSSGGLLEDGGEPQLSLDAKTLAAHASGAWRLVVERTSGLSFDFTLEAAETVASP